MSVYAHHVAHHIHHIWRTIVLTGMSHKQLTDADQEISGL
jgi:hypothetical protein